MGKPRYLAVKLTFLCFSWIIKEMSTRLEKEAGEFAGRIEEELERFRTLPFAADEEDLHRLRHLKRLEKTLYGFHDALQSYKRALDPIGVLDLDNLRRISTSPSISTAYRHKLLKYIKQKETFLRNATAVPSTTSTTAATTSTTAAATAAKAARAKARSRTIFATMQGRARSRSRSRSQFQWRRR